MNQLNAAILQQQAQQLQQQQPPPQHLVQQHAQNLGVLPMENLMNHAFDVMNGTSAAQQLLQHIDMYAKTTLQHQSQQQQHYTQQQQQQQHSLKSSLSSTPTSMSSSSLSSVTSLVFPTSNTLITTPTPTQHQQLFIKQLQKQHSITTTANTSLSTPTTTATNSSLAAFAYQMHNFTQQQQQQQQQQKLYNNTYKLQQQQNLHNQQQIHHHHQMDVQNQQQHQETTTATTLQTTAAALATLSENLTATTLTGAATTTPNTTATSTSTAAVAASTTATTTAAATGDTQQQQQQQHQHQYGNNKSCWCYGESVCSGIEVEIENNNNNHIHHGDSTYHMKILVPAVASGAIIGKGGETIASLQKDTGARVKMSKSHDFYPATTERVCLITGSIEGIMTVMDFIMDKIREKPDLATKIIDAESKNTQERDKQVKILVPNSTAGMIIGKGGAFIKQIKEESGSYVQISQKPKDVSLQERCITIIGDKENNKTACKMILSKIVEDPQSGTCLNVSYADVSGPVANFNPTGSPYATNQNAINSSTASLNSTLGTAIGGAATAAGLLVNGTGINLSLNLSAPNPAPNLAVATQILEHIKVALRGSGYSETATTEVCAALGVLAKYGVLGMGVGVPHANGAHATLGSYLGVSTLDQQTAVAATAATAGNVFGAVGQVNLEQYAAAAAAAAASRPTQTQLEAAAAAVQFDPFRQLAAAPANTPVSLNNNSFGLTAATGTATTAQTLGAASAHALSGLSKSPTPGDLSAKESKNVEIPEVIVGAILGPNGRSLVEIQHTSGANVQISKKGIFAPGTRNRIVTISGQPSAIAKAQILIEQKISEEETKRARQIPLTTVVN